MKFRLIEAKKAQLPSEAVLDKITMSAFEGTPLDIWSGPVPPDTFGLSGGVST